MIIWVVAEFLGPSFFKEYPSPLVRETVNCLSCLSATKSSIGTTNISLLVCPGAIRILPVWEGVWAILVIALGELLLTLLPYLTFEATFRWVIS